MFQIVPAFAVPVAEALMPQCDAVNRDLCELFLAREAEGQRWRNPQPTMQINPALFESDFDLFKWPQACVQTLRDYCWAMLSQTIAQLNGYGVEEMKRLQIFDHTWFHITRKGGFFGLHNHPMASWSGVYCVSCGTGDEEHPESGKLHFANPMALANMFVDPANLKIRTPYSMSGKSYRLRPGQLVLFPSWVAHEVLPFFGEGERITVAFNCWFAMPEAAKV